jgi:hypothetical protein
VRPYKLHQAILGQVFGIGLLLLLFTIGGTGVGAGRLLAVVVGVKREAGKEVGDAVRQPLVAVLWHRL